MRCLRRILIISLRDQLTNNKIWSRCLNPPTIEWRLRWFGHVCRMVKFKLPSIGLERPAKIQNHFAPKNTWIKQIEEDLCNQRLDPTQAKAATIDRKEWRSVAKRFLDPLATKSHAADRQHMTKKEKVKLIMIEEFNDRIDL